MIPIITGMVGIVLVLFIAAWTGGSRKWARTLHVVPYSPSCMPVRMTDMLDQLQLLCRDYYRGMGRFRHVYPSLYDHQW